MRFVAMISGVSATLIACSGPAAREPQPVPQGVAAAAPEWTPARTIVSNDGRWRVGYRTMPSPIVPNEPFSIEVRLAAANKDAVNDDVSLFVDAAMPDHSHGMNVEPKVTPRGDGVFAVDGMDFHMLGRWELYFDISRQGMTSRAQDEITLE
jgi:hypothetical protein